MAEQFLTLSNGAVRHQPYFNSTSDFDYAVTLVDNPTTDTANIVAAAAALNSAGKGKLRLEGVGTLNQGINFTAPISIEMVGKESLLKLAHTSDVYVGFQWGNLSWSPLTATSYDAGAIAAGDAHISSPNLAVSRGEWFMVWSSDAVSGYAPHYPAGSHYPMELHRALGQDGNDIYFDDFIIDPMSTTVKIVKPPMISGIVVKGLKLKYTGATLPQYARALDFRCCTDVVVEDYWCDEDGPGAIIPQYSGDIRLMGIVINGTKGDFNTTNAAYGVVAGIVNGLKFVDSTVRGTRHCFTSSIGPGNGTSFEHSTSRNVNVENVHAQVSGAWTGGSLLEGSRVMFDTHAQSGNITFKDCTATSSGQLGESLIVSSSFQSRGSNVSYKSCRVFAPASGLATGFSIYGSNCLIDGCEVNNGWKGVKIGGSAADVTIRNSEFRNLYGEFVECLTGATGNNLTIEGNTVINCGRSTPTTLITLKAGSGHKIRFNSMPKYSNANAIDLGAVVPTGVEIAGNVMTGYTSTPVDADTDIGIVNEMFRDANIYYVGSRQSVHTNVTGAYALDFSTGPTVFLLTLTGDTTPTVTNPLFRGDYTLIVEQDSVERTVTWTGFSFVDGNPTLNSGAGSFTMLRLYFDGINWYSGA